MVHEIPATHWRLRASSLLRRGDVGRRQQGVEMLGNIPFSYEDSASRFIRGLGSSPRAKHAGTDVWKVMGTEEGPNRAQ